jgi:hypothetical protein
MQLRRQFLFQTGGKITKRKIKECSFTYCIWFRKNDPAGPAYCVEITCTVHQPRATWAGLTNSLEIAKKLIDEFPLVSGGIASGEDAYLIHEDCIIGKIPRKPVEK